jgi:hypothetical protein
MHTAKKKEKEIQKKKSPATEIENLKTATLTPPRQHQKISFSISDASKKETVHKRCRRPIIDLRYSP